ncbi:Rv1733c family protein [Streptomyces olindensis]|uniref:Rv1733c family protein n=1 Tax=Streptomyces olindensis TaxID=358823 RepID=UPI003406DDFC
MSDPIPRAQPPPIRAVPWWRWRRNPLRRPSDLLQAWIGLVLALTVASTAPPAAWAVGTAVHDTLTAAVKEQARAGRHTTAVLLDDAPRHPEPGSAEAGETRYPVKVRYTAPDGTARTATTDVDPGLPAGHRVRVWTNAEGTLTEPPMRPDEIRDRALGAGALTAIGVLITGTFVHRLTARVLDRRRMRAWETAWQQTARRWTTSS